MLILYRFVETSHAQFDKKYTTYAVETILYIIYIKLMVIDE